MSLITNFTRRALIAAAFALPLAACSDSTAVKPGKLSIRLTDAPGNVTAAVVTISQIYLQGGSDSEDSKGRVVLLDTPVTTDLLTLAGTTASLVNEAVVPGGTYSQLRFVITGAYVQVDNGDGTSSIFATSPDYAGLPLGATVTGTLQTPSFSTSGLKVKLPDGSLKVDGDQKILLVDFNVAESFGKEAGNSGKWVMHPVIRATFIGLSGGVNATLSLANGVTLPVVGSTQVTLGDFKATFAQGMVADTVPFTDANADGTFEAAFTFAQPGTYAVNIVAPTGVTVTTTPALPVNASVVSGQNATTAIVINSATTP